MAVLSDRMLDQRGQTSIGGTIAFALNSELISLDLFFREPCAAGLPESLANVRVRFVLPQFLLQLVAVHERERE